MTDASRNTVFQVARVGLLVVSVGLTACSGWGGAQQGQLTFPKKPQGMLDNDPAAALAINPFDPIALNNMAIVEASRGRYQQASSLLQRAVKLAPARADIAANLSSLQRWLAQVEGQAALGMTPQPLQLPYQESAIPDVPPLWAQPQPLTTPTPQAVLPAGRPSR
ncbi:MAG: hypothetical protein C0445_08170 [Polaromonas sp.]|nr:hypothetical protein [Polaromonas sp.]